MTTDAAEVQLVAFDLDDTLAESKTPMEPDMGRALARLLALRPVAIISGGRLQQFEDQVLSRLPSGADLTRLHLLPTCGTRYLRFENGWQEIYNHGLSDDERARAMASVERRARQLGFWEPDDKVDGERVEDRGSQITFSALGQHALPSVKRQWDPDGTKRHALRDAVAADIPDLSVSAGGSTSIDITRRGVDKAFGMVKLSEQTGVALRQMLFVGDRTEPGGNDNPVVLLGVPVITVTGWQNTLEVIFDLCDQLEGRP